MRIDRLLCYLRFTRSRALAAIMVKRGIIRCNGQRVSRISHPVAAGDVLTLPTGKTIRIIEILELPDRRGSALAAAGFYRDLSAPECDSSG